MPDTLRYIAQRIPWRPGSGQMQAIRQHARAKGVSPEDLRLLLLIDGFLRVLIGIAEGIPLKATLGGLPPVVPLGSLAPQDKCTWIVQQTVKSTELLLEGRPYVPELELALVLACSPRGGRPPTFRGVDDFLAHVEQAVEYLRRTGARVTQGRVAKVLLPGSYSDPVRQFQQWTKDFDFSGWAELLEAVSRQP